MKRILLLSILTISIIGCSSSKEIAKETTNEIPVIDVVDNESNAEEISNKEINNKINNKINSIIQNYLGIHISSVARSDIEETTNGYQWKFMNVKTGENFIANSDVNFEKVTITKNKRS